MDYKDCKPIRPTIATVWLITQQDGKRIITIWHKDAKIEDVVGAHRLSTNCDFKIINVGAGTFEVTKSHFEHWMAMDGRQVDQNLQITI